MRGMKQTDLILCKTRTGKKVHHGYPTSSVTLCGHWQKVANSQYRLDLTTEQLREVARMGDMVLCEHCFPNGLNGYEVPVAAEPVNPRDMTIKELIESEATEGTDLRSRDARFHAAYLFRTMSVQDRFSYLSQALPPRMQKVYDKVMQAGGGE